jgi:hypothetical protein
MLVAFFKAVWFVIMGCAFNVLFFYAHHKAILEQKARLNIFVSNSISQAEKP